MRMIDCNPDDCPYSALELQELRRKSRKDSIVAILSTLRWQDYAVEELEDVARMLGITV